MQQFKKISIGHSGKHALVDIEDYKKLIQRKWYMAEGYAQAQDYYKGKRTRILMHRLILDAPEDKQSATGHKGISFDANKYCVNIKKHYKTYYGGRHSTIEEAIKAHSKLAYKLHGEFARLKQPIAA